MSVPTLSERAAREQRTFRQVLEAMARPGTVAEVEPHAEGGRFAAAVALLEALLDHEVSFAVVPDAGEAREPLLRYTGSRAFPPERADFMLCHGNGIALGLAVARDGELEYPDRSATVVALVDAVDVGGNLGERLTLSGPGVKTKIDVWIAGFGEAERALFGRRNAGLPQGVDLVLVAPDGRFTCLPRYTQIDGLEA